MMFLLSTFLKLLLDMVCHSAKLESQLIVTVTHTHTHNINFLKEHNTTEINVVGFETIQTMTLPHG